MFQDRNLPRSPAWAPTLAPLAGAPIPNGSTVGLVPPAGSSLSYARSLLLEAAWRRPDLFWVPLEELRLGLHASLVVTVGAPEGVPGWHEVWHGGTLRLLRRERP